MGPIAVKEKKKWLSFAGNRTPIPRSSRLLPSCYTEVCQRIASHMCAGIAFLFRWWLRWPRSHGVWHFLVWSLMFRNNISLLSSRSKSNPSKNTRSKRLNEPHYISYVLFSPKRRDVSELYGFAVRKFELAAAIIDNKRYFLIFPCVVGLIGY
jgi:hypothetical protein